MTQKLQDLFETVRRECSSRAWSRGVELVRADAVRGDSDGASEIVLRISERGGLLCSTVTLYPEERDWECDCGSPQPGCEHVAAAVIALRRARERGAELPGPAPGEGRIGYHFRRCDGGLALDRAVLRGGEDQTLKSTLAAIASGRVDGPAFLASETDLAVERILGSRLHGVLPRGIVTRLLEALVDSPNVTLDGVSIRTSAERIGLRGRLVDAEGGFALCVGRDPRITEVIGVDTVLCGDTLHATAQTNLTGRELEELRRGRNFAPAEVAELITEILPSLSKRIPIDIRTKRLPKTVSEHPRLALDVRRDGDMLSALPTLVYGDPAIARVDAGRLVLLGDAVPLRDEAAERRLIRKIQNELQLLPGHRVRFSGEEAVAFASRLERWDGEIHGDAHEAFYVAPALVPRLEIGADGFDLCFLTSGAADASAPETARRADPARVLRAWRERASLVPLEGGGWAPLPADWLERFGDRVADLLAAREETGEIPRCALLDLARLCEDLDASVPPAVESLRARIENFDGISSREPPADLTGALREYQRRGVDWLCALRDAGLGALLADDMGLGKTLQALCALRGRTLVVAPTSVLHNWAREIERFRPSLVFQLFHGPQRSLDPNSDVTLTSYAVLRLDAERLASVEWDTAILDEAQAIKNPDSQVARAAYRLRADFRITLSGTPVENRLDELWSQFHFINRGLLGGRKDFEERYARPITEGSAGSAERLRARIQPFVLRRLKREVAPQLPPRTEVVLRVALSESERATYAAVRAATLGEVVAKLSSGGGVIAALEALLRLRQAACHPALVPGQRAETSSKLELLMEIVDEAVAEGHKALVFSQWTSLLDLVEPHLHAADIRFARLDGSTRDRAGVVDGFQSEAGPPILLASLKTGGVGLNLTAADHVFILDPWWNPFAEDQAADRAHRIGQERPVSIYRLVAEATVEERILALQETKRGLADAALGAGQEAGRLTREELLALLD